MTYVNRPLKFSRRKNVSSRVGVKEAEPETCPRTNIRFLKPPKPPGALDDIMKAIEGDGTPWSYLSASLFARECREFGAMWHGCNWSTHKIGKDPQHSWIETGVKPREWRPVAPSIMNP